MQKKKAGEDMISRIYISNSDQVSLVEKNGWKTMTICRILHETGITTNDIKSKKVSKSLLSKRYAWKTEEEFDMIKRGLIWWWLTTEDLSTYHYIPSPDYESGINNKMRMDYFNIDRVTMRLIRDIIFRGIL